MAHIDAVILTGAQRLWRCGNPRLRRQNPRRLNPNNQSRNLRQRPPRQWRPSGVAVVMPSAINDLAFSQSIYDALMAIQSEMGAENFEFGYSENMFVVDTRSGSPSIYASQGYNLVIAHGSQYGSSLLEIAPDFPETSFAWGTTVDTFVDQGVTNVYAYGRARSEQGGYVNGVIAASLSESNVLGVVGPIETGDAKVYVDGFVVGAKLPNRISRLMSTTLALLAT